MNYDEYHKKYGLKYLRLLDKYRGLIAQQSLNYFKKKNLSFKNIIDFGSSGAEGSNQVVKIFSNILNIKDVTCVGIEDFESIKKREKFNFVNIEKNTALPFKNDSFDLAVCHAVYEHITDPKIREFYLNEMFRVAKTVIITVPNRYFPLDWHLMVPFLGYLPEKTIYKIIKFFPFKHWSDFNENTLCYHSKKSISSIQILQYDTKIDETFFCGIKLGPFSSNIIRVLSR